jgi:hypothetical protein
MQLWYYNNYMVCRLIIMQLWFPLQLLTLVPPPAAVQRQMHSLYQIQRSPGPESWKSSH